MALTQGPDEEENCWQLTLLEEMSELDGFSQFFGDAAAASVGIHLAVLNEPYLTRILEGQKTIESRFSINRQPPFGRVQEGDMVLLKKTSGPVIGSCIVDYVWHYELTAGQLDEIRTTFAQRLCADDPEFWLERAEKNYATLMKVSGVVEIEPLQCEKRDRRGWVVIRSRDSLDLQ